MATRIEKIFKTKTIQLMNSILNEINSLIDTEEKPSEEEYIAVHKRIVHSICGFYYTNKITDNEIRKALNND